MSARVGVAVTLVHLCGCGAGVGGWCDCGCHAADRRAAEAVLASLADEKGVHTVDTLGRGQGPVVVDGVSAVLGDVA